MTQRISELQTSLREQLAQVQEQLSQSEARHQEQLTQVEARHQQKMAKVMTSMREMFAQLSPCMRDLDTSQVPNKCYLAKHYFCNALLCDINMMPLIYSGWKCLMWTLHGNETMNPQVKQIRLFVITYTTILGKK